MAHIIWKLPVPSTALLAEMEFVKRPGRVCALESVKEADDNGQETIELLFRGVEAFKCTHHHARTLQMIQLSYDEVIDLGGTDWLGEVKTQLSRLPLERHEGLRHLMVNFDDGPCYEFICREFEARVGGRHNG